MGTFILDQLEQEEQKYLWSTFFLKKNYSIPVPTSASMYAWYWYSDYMVGSNNNRGYLHF